MRKFLLLCLVLTITESVWPQMSLEAYRSRVYAFSTELMSAEVAIDKAYADMRMAHTDFLPSLSASGSFTTSFRRVRDGDMWGFVLQPQVEQVLYGGGAVRAAYRQAQNNYDYSQYNELQMRLNVRYAADHAYWSLSAMKLYVAATNEYVGFINSLYHVVQERFREGYVAKSDVLQVEARLSEARYSQIALQNNYEVSLHRFNTMLGRDGDMEVTLANSIIDSISMPQRISIDEMLERCPDMRMAELARYSAEQGVVLARARYNPRLTAGVRGSWQTYVPNSTGRTYLDGALILGLSVPIFHWGARRHDVSAAQAAVLTADNDIVQLRRDAAQQESDGWSALTNSFSQIRSSLQNLEIASSNLSLSTYSYREGQATILDVLQAQISWLQIYTNAITARFNYAVAVSEYMRLAALE